jgi:Spy/CpxP family protein refolding chaperone
MAESLGRIHSDGKREVKTMALCSMAVALGVVGVMAAMKRLLFRGRFGACAPWALAACGPGLGAGGDGRGCGDDEAYGRRGRFRAGPGRSFWLRAVFARLDTTPGQEREIRAAIEELQTASRQARAGMAGAREDVAQSIRGDSVDEVSLNEASRRADAMAAQMKDALTVALKRVHAVLDARQRERLAELLAKGPGWGPWGRSNPYRDAV